MINVFVVKTSENDRIIISLLLNRISFTQSTDAYYFALDNTFLAEDEQGDQQRPGEELPAGVERERARAHSQGPHDRHRIGGQADGQECLGDRRHDLGPGRAQESVQHEGLGVGMVLTSLGAVSYTHLDVYKRQI